MFLPWQWETFDAVLREAGIRVADPGPLVSPVRSFEIRRDAEGDLVLQTKAAGALKHSRIHHRPGTVHEATAVVTFEGQGGMTASATGVMPGSRIERRNEDGVEECRQSSRVTSVEIRVRPGPAAYVLDWLENVDHESVIWMGELVHDVDEDGKSRTIGEGPMAVTFEGGLGGQHLGTSAFALTIGGVELFLCGAPDVPNRRLPGYILYRGTPDETTRRKIRNALGFTLGIGLVYLGSSHIGAQSRLVSTFARSAQDYGGQIYGYRADAPAPLGGSATTNMVEQSEVCRIAEAIFRHYDEMDFDALSYAYWHGVCAPIHMRAIHFGAAIEGLQRAYIKSRPDSARTKLIADAGLAKTVRMRLMEAMAELDLSSDIHAALSNKISNINTVSGAQLADRVFEELGLKLGAAERTAWGRRNDAAHGKSLATEDSVSVIRDAKLLRTLLNRIVLRMASASETYIDRYTVGFALRPLNEPVPGDG